MHYHRPKGAVPRHPNVSIGALHGFVMRALMTYPDLLVCVSLGVEQLAGPRLALDGAAVDGVRRDGSGAGCLLSCSPSASRAAIGNSVAVLCRRRDRPATDCALIGRVLVAAVLLPFPRCVIMERVRPFVQGALLRRQPPQ